MDKGKARGREGKEDKGRGKKGGEGERKEGEGPQLSSHTHTVGGFKKYA